MDPFSSLCDEVKFLADVLFDGQMNHSQMERLETLIVQDVACMQAYVERMTFHAELLKDSREQSPAQASATAIKEFTQAVRIRERRRWLMSLGLYAAMALCLIAATGGMLFVSGIFQASPVAVISNLASEIRAQSGNLELGQVLRQGETFAVHEGLLSLQLPNVLVDVLGPATFRMESASRVHLLSGTVLAKITPGGEGFTITTRDVTVVDLGTEFLVCHAPGEGTNVSVRQGRAQASLLDWRGKPSKIVELTDHRSAVFQASSQVSREIVFQEDLFTPIDRVRGGIRSIDGAVRTGAKPHVALSSGQVLTPRYMLVIPEQQNLVLSQELVVNGVEGNIRIPAGSSISSYLVHYDPTALVTAAPRGAVTFFEEIATIIVDANDLKKTDALLGLPGLRFESATFRQFELDEDEARISKDRHTASFYCGINPSEFLDEARIIVFSSGRTENVPKTENTFIQENSMK